MGYRAPLGDHRLLMQLLGFDALARDRFAEATPETVTQVLTEAARLAEDVALFRRLAAAL